MKAQFAYKEVTMRLANKVSIITGAGAGMGYAAAHFFAREGSKVAVVDIDEATGRAAAESVRAQGGDAEFFHCDVGDAASVEAMMNAVICRVPHQYAERKRPPLALLVRVLHHSFNLFILERREKIAQVRFDSAPLLFNRIERRIIFGI